jgi:ABC-type transport system involved in multi-copper enzyme maturation permease subunit
MPVLAFITGLPYRLHESWLGPHFWYDTIHLARKGWPTLARVIFLVIVLVSLLVMNRTQGESVEYTKPAEFAQRADNFATLLLVLQNLLVLAILPVYVATAIVEEKENQTLEALTLTQLSDRELVLGKLGARLLHVGALALAIFPLLAFMHLWGNVSAATLIYHEILVFLLLLSAGSVCMWVSTTSESVFQAISHSYGLLAIMGFISIVAAFGLPWSCGFRNGAPLYWIALPVIAAPHLIVTGVALKNAILRVEYLRREERRKPRKLTGALTMTDGQKISSKVGKRGQTKSRIHPLAWPIGDNALHWKECLKDGTTYSLTVRWLATGLVGVAVASGLIQLLHALFSGPYDNLGLRGITLPFVLSAYFIGLITYTLVVVFQMTMTVASEREQGTMIFLLMLPVERREIFVAKWLGPWWRNWPILAVCYLGVLLGLGSGLHGLVGALVMALLPWPLLLMLAACAFCLSVVCRRVLYANIAVVSLLGILVIAHIAWGTSAWHALAFFLAIITSSSLGSWGVLAEWQEVAPVAFGQQAAFLAVAVLALCYAYWMFQRKNYST